MVLILEILGWEIWSDSETNKKKSISNWLVAAIPRRLPSPNMLEGWTRSVAMEITYISTSYRDAEYLQTCNRSVLEQVNVVSRHIIVIDGYESQELEKFKRSKNTCSRTIILENAKNEGKSVSVNKAIKTCETRYIALLDADDVVFPEKSYRQLKFLEQDNSKAVVGCSYISFLDKNKRIFHCIKAPSEVKDAWSQIYLSPTSLYSSLVIDRNRLSHPELDEELKCAMDYKFNLDCLNAGIITNIPGYHCGYRVRNKSITRSDKRINQLINHSRILFNRLLTDGTLTINEQIIIERLYALGLSKIANDSEKISRTLMLTIETTDKELDEVLGKVLNLNCDGHRSILVKKAYEILSIGSMAKRRQRNGN